MNAVIVGGERQLGQFFFRDPAQRAHAVAKLLQKGDVIGFAGWQINGYFF